MNGHTDSYQRTLAAIRRMDAATLSALWAGRESAPWSADKNFYMQVAKRWLSQGEPLLAYDVMTEALSAWDDDALSAQAGLALARCGASESANLLLNRLYQRGVRDEETVGILARTFKDLWALAAGAGNTQQATAHLQRCAALYLEGYRASGSYWTGINAASTALLQGDEAAARSLAQQVFATCHCLLLEQGDALCTDYWLLATLGEAALVLADLPQAQAYYTRATRHGAHGDMAATRRNARLLTRLRGVSAEQLDQWLPAPRIVIATGHMLDAPGRGNERFPARCEAAVRAAIEHFIRSTGASVGYASAACGADLLFLETMLALGGEAHVVLPQAPAHFLQTSVAFAGGHWPQRFQSVLERASSVTVTSEDLSGDISFAYANVLIYGMAKAKARQLDGQLHALALWDGEAGGLGGTGSAVTSWSAAGQAVQVIAPLTLARHMLAPVPQRRGAMCTIPEVTANAAHDGESRVVAILFADAVGFSKLLDRQIPHFMKHFLGRIGELLDERNEAPLVRNTWGDGLYFVFASIHRAGAFALALRDRISQVDWPALGLPADLNLRIALHCGPAYAVFDPVIKLASYTGAHVSRAARIEPVTPPGEVYASAAFAAVSEAMGAVDFTCGYVGQMPLAKKYGSFPTYRLQWSGQQQPHPG